MALDGTVLELPDTPERERSSLRQAQLALVWVRPSDYGLRKRGERVLVRLIRYTIEDPNRPGHRVEHRLITSLLDPERAGAEELVVAYHSRWEFELATDEIKSHQSAPLTRPFAPRKP
jgi:hypothetical protein